MMILYTWSVGGWTTAPAGILKSTAMRANTTPATWGPMPKLTLPQRVGPLATPNSVTWALGAAGAGRSHAYLPK
jgi:hypothetical protein